MKESENQLLLFDIDCVSEIGMDFLHVIKDMTPIRMSIEEIFDVTKYDELFAVTFVASPKFFLNTINGFRKIRLILGISDSGELNTFTNGVQSLLNMKERISIWQSFDEETKENFRNNLFSIRYGMPGISIHSKIYLMVNSVTGNNRVVIGSANFTQNGFVSNKQFEEVLVFDNSVLFDQYLKRYHEILEHTLDYIPEQLLKTRKPTELNVLTDPETITNFLVHDLDKNRNKIAIPEEVMNQILDAPDSLENTRNKTLETIKVLELVVKKDVKTGISKPITASQLKGKASKLQALVTKTYQKNSDLDNRRQVFYDPKTSLLFEKNEDDNDTENRLIMFSKESTNENIKMQLSLIHKFVDAYNLFTVQEDLDNQRKIFETILYAFMSTYIWKVRDHYSSLEGSGSGRSSFPPFLILSGRSSSGKTTVLEFIGLLLGNTPAYRSFEEMQKFLNGYFETENILPILVDEVAESFFSGKRGERVIKFVSNELVGVHPCMIGTTNASTFSMPAQMARRIYYLQINNTFTHEKYAESRKYLSEIQQEIDTSLFKDFTSRMSQLLKNNTPFYTLDDPLYAARMIFKKYYEETGLELPPYFPETTYDDYRQRGRAIWFELYKRFQAHFDVYKDENKIFVDIDAFSKVTKDKDAKINMLPVECIAEDNNILVLKKDLFFQFIGVKVEKPSLLQRLFPKRN